MLEIKNSMSIFKYAHFVISWSDSNLKLNLNSRYFLLFLSNA